MENNTLIQNLFGKGELPQVEVVASVDDPTLIKIGVGLLVVIALSTLIIKNL